MIRALAQLILADVRERTRSSGFMMTLVPATYLAYTVHAGYWTMRHGGYAAEPSGAYVSTMMALLSGTILSLIGFYFVKNTIDRDRRTGVGEILATTPVTGWLYLLGKAISNFLVLSLMVGVIAAAAVWFGSAASFEPSPGWARILVTFVLLALPLMAITAAAAVLFEAMPFLRSGAGNVVWFFAWGALLIASSTRWTDVAGYMLVQKSLAASLHQAYPDVKDGLMSLSAGTPRELSYFPWSGLTWPIDRALSRLVWFAAAAALAVGSAIGFDRFDPTRRRQAADSRPRRREGAARSDAVAKAPTPRAELVGWLMTASRYVSPLAGLPRLLLLEARLLLGGQPWLWHAGALGLLVAQVLAPLEIVRPHLVTFALIWPLLVWSPMGCRDRLLGTLDLMNATPQPSLRQLPASWLAGVGIGVAITLPAFVRLAVSGDTSAAVALALAWLVPPSLAIAAGTWSGNARLFEAVYLLLWYVGILNRIPQLDFAGTTDLAIARGTPAVAAMAAMVLLVSAWLRRGRLSRER